MKIKAGDKVTKSTNKVLIGEGAPSFKTKKGN